MYWILFVMAAIAAVAIALVIGGLATPREHVVTRGMVLPDAPDVVFAAVHDSIQHGSMSFSVTEEHAPRRLVADRLDDNLQPDGTWTWSLEPEGAGTRITISQRASVGNPIVRFLGAFTGYKRHVDRYLRELAERVGSPRASIDGGRENRS